MEVSPNAKAHVINIDRASGRRTPGISARKLSAAGIVTPGSTHETANLLVDISIKTLMNIHDLDRRTAERALLRTFRKVATDAR